MKNKSVMSMIIIYVIAFVTIIWIVVMFFKLFFLVKDYRYFEYNNQKYYLDSNLCIDDAIIYNEDGEFDNYQNCTEVIVKINGWFPKRMLLHNSNKEMFIFDSDKLIWGIKNGEKSYPTFEVGNISNVFICFWDDSQEYTLGMDDIKKICDIRKYLMNSSTEIIDWEKAPSGIKNGTLNISYKSFPSDVTYSMFYFSVSEKEIFLMSLTDSFGLKFGSYTITGNTGHGSES